MFALPDSNLNVEQDKLNLINFVLHVSLTLCYNWMFKIKVFLALFLFSFCNSKLVQETIEFQEFVEHATTLIGVNRVFCIHFFDVEDHSVFFLLLKVSTSYSVLRVKGVFLFQVKVFIAGLNLFFVIIIVIFLGVSD